MNELLLRQIAERHDAEVLRIDGFFILSNKDNSWNQYSLADALVDSGFDVDEGIDINGLDVLVVGI